MLPKFKNGDRVIVQKWLLSPTFKDVVVLKDPRNGKLILKRIVNIRHAQRNEGSTRDDSGFKIKDLEKEDLLQEYLLQSSGALQAQNDKKLEFFVEGDNKKESTDSRTFGWVKQDRIIGKAIFPKA